VTHGDQIRECIPHDTDPVYGPVVNRYGCRVFCLIAIPQFISSKCLMPDQVQTILDLGRSMPGVIIDDTMTTGTQEHELINMGFRLLGVKRNGRQVGWKPEHLINRTWQYMIGHWETDGKDGHFTLFDRAQKEIYDPAQGDEINKKRIVRRLLYATWQI
jgi:hypothetical protein